MTPYRSATMTAPVDPVPWWQRAWFRVARGSACERWQWARRESGGRWCRARLFDYGVLPPFDECLGDLWLRVEGCVLDWPDGPAVIWPDRPEGVSVAWPCRTKCVCEVYP